MARAGEPRTPRRVALTDRLDRRVVLKAAASLAAASVAFKSGAKTNSAIAQVVPETKAATWREQDFLAAWTLPGVDDKVVQCDFEFRAVAPHWDSDVGTWPRIEMSFSSDGVNWGPTVTASASDHDAGRPDREGRTFGSLLFPGRNSFIRYRTLDELGNPAQVPGLEFTYIDASPGPTLQSYSAEFAAHGAPPIISRNAWGANESYRYEDGEVAWTPRYQRVEHAIIHHTETPNFEDPLIAIRSIYYYHAVTRGWGDIGYNYLVDFMGNVYEGRYGGENVIGGHSYQYAHGSSGIGTMGSFHEVEPTPEMIAGLVWIVAWVTRDLDPYGTSDFHEKSNLPTICAHRDVNDTTCPGDSLYFDLQQIRNYVSAVLYEGHTPGPAPGRFTPGQAVEVVVDGANLRGKPGLSGWLAGTMPLGTVLVIADGPTTTDGMRWYQVSGTIGTGWCAEDMLGPTNQPPPMLPGPFSVGDEVVVATDALKLRDAPRLSGGVLAVLPTAATASILDGAVRADGYTWYQLRSDYGIGWSVAEFLARPGSALPAPPGSAFGIGDEVEVATDALNLRSGAGLQASVIAILPTGFRGTVIDGPVWSDGLAWYGLETAYGDGWSVADYLRIAGAAGGTLAEGDIATVATDALNLRDEPGLSAGVLAVMPTGTTVTILAGPSEADGLTWYRVASDRFGRGWCAGDYLVPGGAGSGFTSGQQARVFDGALNLRAEPSVTAAVLAVMADGTTLTIDYGPSQHDGYDWWYVDGPYGSGWCVGAYLAPL